MNYSDEEVTSTHGYISGYTPNSIAEQVGLLKKFFPSTDLPDGRLAERPLPAGAEGWFAIPVWQVVGSNYRDALERVLVKMCESRSGKVKNWLRDELDRRFLKESEKTTDAFAQLQRQQNGHQVVILAAQFGLRQRGRSVRRAREVMASQEFGLSTFAASIMLLTHPERLMHYNDLYVVCAGDEYDPSGNGRSSDVLSFRFGNGQIDLDADWIGAYDPRYSIPSGFLA